MQGTHGEREKKREMDVTVDKERIQEMMRQGTDLSRRENSRLHDGVRPKDSGDRPIFEGRISVVDDARLEDVLVAEGLGGEEGEEKDPQGAAAEPPWDVWYHIRLYQDPNRLHHEVK